MTNYTTIFEFTPKPSNIYHLIVLLVFAIIGVGFAIYTKRMDKDFSYVRQLKIFFGFILGGIATVMLIISIVKIPEIISTEKNLRQKIENQDFLIAKGEISNFKSTEINGQTFESFLVDGIKFEYSDYNIINGFHQTSKMNGPIKQNGQLVRISYITVENENLIMRIEIKDSTTTSANPQ